MEHRIRIGAVVDSRPGHEMGKVSAKVILESFGAKGRQTILTELALEPAPFAPPFFLDPFFHRFRFLVRRKVQKRDFRNEGLIVVFFDTKPNRSVLDVPAGRVRCIRCPDTGRNKQNHQNPRQKALDIPIRLCFYPIQFHENDGRPHSSCDLDSLEPSARAKASK